LLDLGEKDSFEDDEALGSDLPPGIRNKILQGRQFLSNDLVIGYNNITEQSGKYF
jgi:hypothetical protein